MYARTPTMQVCEEAPIWGWHSSINDYLNHGDNREIKIGETLSVEPPIRICDRGLHLCHSPMSTLVYEHNPLYLWLVQGWGETQLHQDKIACQHRRAVAVLPFHELVEITLSSPFCVRHHKADLQESWKKKHLANLLSVWCTLPLVAARDFDACLTLQFAYVCSHNDDEPWPVRLYGPTMEYVSASAKQHASVWTPRHEQHAGPLKRTVAPFLDSAYRLIRKND